MLDNHLNSRTRELIKTVKNAKEELNVVLAREEHRERLITDLKSKCDKVTEDIEKDPIVRDLRSNTMKLATRLKEAQVECGRLKMEEAKAIGLKERVSVLESKYASLKSEKNRLIDQKTKLQQETDALNLRCESFQRDRADIVAKVIPYIAMELYHSDEVGQVVANLVNAAIFHGKCTTLEEIAETGKPVILSKVPYYRTSHGKEYDDASNAFASADFPFLSKVTQDPDASVKKLLSQKPNRIRPPSPTERVFGVRFPSRQEGPSSSKNA